MIKNVKYVFVSCILAFSSCKSSLKNDNSEFDALLTKSEFNRAVKIYEGIDYLPDSFIIDGCHMRAFFISLELAVHKIPSSHLFVVTRKDNAETLDNHWNWHTAPVFKMKEDKSIAVLDLALSKSPVPLEIWVDVIEQTGTSVLVSGFNEIPEGIGMKDFENPFLLLDEEAKKEVTEKWIETIDELPPIRLQYFQMMLSLAIEYTVYENLNDKNLGKEKIEKLEKNIRRMIESLPTSSSLYSENFSQRSALESSDKLFSKKWEDWLKPESLKKIQNMAIFSDQIAHSIREKFEKAQENHMDALHE